LVLFHKVWSKSLLLRILPYIQALSGKDGKNSVKDGKTFVRRAIPTVK
jgi:hypothetical protein